jgi:hypothetical protein
MTTSGSGSGKQASPPAAGKATRASTAPVNCGPAPAGMPERDLMSSCMHAEHMTMDGFTWHSISCACNNCVRNDDKFMITFNRPDFRH